jgi:hypothetical protein
LLKNFLFLFAFKSAWLVSLVILSTGSSIMQPPLWHPSMGQPLMMGQSTIRHPSPFVIYMPSQSPVVVGLPSTGVSLPSAPMPAGYPLEPQTFAPQERHIPLSAQKPSPTRSELLSLCSRDPQLYLVKQHLGLLLTDQKFCKNIMREMQKGGENSGRILELVKILIPYVSELMFDEHANGIVQKMLESGCCQAKLVNDISQAGIINLSLHPYGSKVIQKALVRLLFWLCVRVCINALLNL